MIHSNRITLGMYSLKAANQNLKVEIKGVDKEVVPGDMFGLDDVYLAKKAKLSCHC